MDLFEEMRKTQKRLFEDFYHWPYLSWPRLALSEPKERELIKFEIPAEDLKETDKELLATFDLPGISKEDIQLKVTEDEIEVKAEKKQELKEEKKGYFRQERSYQGFYRKSSLPQKVRPEAVTAEYKNGVLVVKMPKKEIELKKKKGIAIKVK